MKQDRDPHLLLFKELETVLPRMEEADKHDNRKLVVDLMNYVTEKIDKNRLLPSCTKEYKKVYRDIEKQLRVYLINTAWKNLRDQGRLPYQRKAKEEAERKRIEAQEGERAGAKRKGKLSEKAAGVVQANTKEKRSRDIREVYSGTASISSHNDNPAISDNLANNGLAISDQVASPNNLTSMTHNQARNNPLSTAHDPNPTSPTPKKLQQRRKIDLDKPANMCDTPFSIKDFVASAVEPEGQEKELSREELIQQAKELIEELTG